MFEKSLIKRIQSHFMRAYRDYCINNINLLFIVLLYLSYELIFWFCSTFIVRVLLRRLDWMNLWQNFLILILDDFLNFIINLDILKWLN